MKERESGAHSVKAMMATAGLLLAMPAAQGAEVDVVAGPPLAAEPGDFTLKLEPGVPLPLTDPQSARFKVGGAQTVKALWLLTENLDLGPSVTFMSLPSEVDARDAGTAWTFGASARIKRSHTVADAEGLGTISPWADIDALYVRTGDLHRPGMAIAAGLAVPIGESRVFWLGPFVRYLQILQGTRAGFDSTDAKILTLGVSLEVGSGIRRERRIAMVAAPPAEVRTVDREVFVCADGDKDEVPDKVDRCPEVAGTAENWGCPEYKKVVVKRDKLELKEKLFFAWNQAVIQEVSHPVLDEVVQALKENKSFRVQVQGHSSSEGGNDHNQTLSEQRARAVIDYLVAHGVDKERLVSKGLADTVPIDSNATVAGRENNRRVEFVVNFALVDDGSK